MNLAQQGHLDTISRPKFKTMIVASCRSCHLPKLVFYLALFFSLFLVKTANATAASDKPLPSPLGLKTALAFAFDHPAAQSGDESLQRLATHSPLFLACHDQAFTNTEVGDPARNDHSTPLVAPLVRQQLRIIQAFLDVRLADLNHAYINEKMAGAYIDYDRAKTRQELKQVSEIDVARLHDEYQQVRQQFHASEATQRLTRSVLAQSLNRPLQLPADINPPPLPVFPTQLPELESVYQEATQNNDWFKQQTKTDDLNKTALLSMALRQELLEMLLRLRALRTASEQVKVAGLSRDLNLELSRTLYEMEVKADLGDSMTWQSRVRLDTEIYHYCQLLAWAQLNALRGRDLLVQPDQPKPTDIAE